MSTINTKNNKENKKYNNKIIKNYKKNKVLNNIISKVFPTSKSIFGFSFLSRADYSNSPKNIMFDNKTIKLIPYITSKITENIVINYNKIRDFSSEVLYQTNKDNIVFKLITLKDPKSLIFHYLLYKYYKNNKNNENNENIKYLYKLYEFGYINEYNENTIKKFYKIKYNENNKLYYIFQEDYQNDLYNKYYLYSSLHKNMYNFKELLELFNECCKALKIIHDIKYLHLNIMPQNFIFINDQIKITGFTNVKKNKYKTKELFGKMNYISNDWLINSYQSKETTLECHHDIFSLGCMFIELFYKFILKEKIFMTCPIKKLPIAGEDNNITKEKYKEYIGEKWNSGNYGNATKYRNFLTRFRKGDLDNILPSSKYKAYRKEYNNNDLNEMLNNIEDHYKNNGFLKNYVAHNAYTIRILFERMVNPDPIKRCNNINEIIDIISNNLNGKIGKKCQEFINEKKAIAEKKDKELKNYFQTENEKKKLKNCPGFHIKNGKCLEN